jgi:hypothetical protein
MKTSILKTTGVVALAALMLAASCKKNKKSTTPETPPQPTPDPQEVITTFKLILTDSATNIKNTYLFKDPDGDGGQVGFYGPSNTVQTDSVFTLAANKTYFGQIVLLDETKNPADSISNEVKKEGKEHLFFYNNSANTILNSGNPYTVVLNGSNIKITYLDLDDGTPQRGIGLQTKWRTSSATGSTKHLLNITLKHQPDAKNGTFAPGETDSSVNFKVKVN